MDTQRIHNLIEYLEELHDHEKASADHTTLLLNCYAKLKDTAKLDSFIKAPGELKFDLETAIAMCRQGGYFEQAAYLATKHGEHDMVVDILIEDSRKYAEALEFIWRLDASVVRIFHQCWPWGPSKRAQAYPNLMKYARVLLEHCPDETTKLFIDYYTGQYRPKKDVEPAKVEAQPTSTVQSLAAFIPLPYVTSSTTTKSKPAEAQVITEDEDAKAAPSYEIPKPSTAFSLFVDHPDQFITLLEALVASEPSEEDKVDIYTTLFEMYLDRGKRQKDQSNREEWENKAKKLLEDKDVSLGMPTTTGHCLTTGL